LTEQEKYMLMKKMFISLFSVSQTQPANKKWVNNTGSRYHSQTEFEYLIDKFDDDNSDV
jgi:hypothetical protein